MAKENENQDVVLKAKGEKGKDRKFPIGQANKILSLSNSQWELNDKGFSWNGKEIVKAKA